MKRISTNGISVIMAIVMTMLSGFAFVSCETYDDTEIKESLKDLENRVKALEDQVAKNIEALQSMVSLGSITSCGYDAENGKVVITLKDGQVINIDLNSKGTSLLTIIEKDGKYYWGISKDGSVESLVINGKNVPVEVTPAAKLSEDGEWLLSADGGLTWVATGIFQSVSGTDPGVSFFKNVQIDGNYLILTLSDGKTVKVKITGDSSFTAAETTLWFTRAGEEKMISLSMTDVKAFTITEKPEGWKAYIEEENLHVTAPSNPAEYANTGTIKILAVFEGGADPEILSIEVNFEYEISLEADSFGTVKVGISEHAGEDFPGYVIKVWKVSEFSVEAALAWFNGNGASITPYSEAKTFNIKDITEGYKADESYVVCAASYIPSRLIASGDRKYTEADLHFVTYSPAPMGIEVSNVTYDSAHIAASFSGINEYYAGISATDDWNNYVKENIFEMLGWNGLTPYSFPSYNGPAANFPDGNTSINILPDTQYTVWVIPTKKTNMYSDKDIMVKTFKTPALKSDASVAVPAFQVHSITYGGFTADITPASGAYKTYANILSGNSIPGTDLETVTQLIKGNKFSEGSASFSVSTNSFNADTDVYLLAVTVSKDGKYGKIVKEKVDLKKLTYTDAVGITGCNVEYGVGDVTLDLSFKGSPSTITYMTASYTYYTLDLIEQMMAMSQFGDVMDLDITTLEGGNRIHITDLQLGVPYTFYALVKDADGVPSHIFTKEFTPAISIDYVMSTDSGYSYGMPQLGGSWKNDNTFVLNVKKPAECTKFWFYKGDPEYFTGDPWIDTDRLVGQQLNGVEVHTESIENKTFTTMYEASRFYIAWLDDKGNYHAIYEYDPHKQ